ncbi:MAG: ion transporter [Planctomycetota bacterium]
MATTFRARLFRQLSVSAWDGPGISPLNTIVTRLILLNLVLQVLETEPVVREALGGWLQVLDWCFVGFFAVEYVARVWVAGENPVYRGALGRVRYMLTFFSLVDLVSILPALVSFGSLDSSGMRALRLLRVLRFARFGAFSVALETMVQVFRSRAYELTASLLMVGGVLLAAATAMYFAEAEAQPEAFGSIPRALWWAVVTMTTVGYGDTYPVTSMGKVLAGIVALVSIALVAVPTGIVASAFVDLVDERKASRRQGAGDPGEQSGS